jgi:hypothetical protein
MDQEEWARWKNNRATKKFFKFIADFREQTAREIAAIIADGVSIPKEVMDKTALRCELYKDLEAITCEEISQFYQPEKEEEDEQDNES